MLLVGESPGTFESTDDSEAERLRLIAIGIVGVGLDDILCFLDYL